MPQLLSKSKRDGLHTIGEIITIHSARIYQLAITPLVFTAFLLSLTYVDLRLSLQRFNSHAEAPSILPQWLSRLLNRRQPYVYLQPSNGQKSGPSEAADGHYYHTKQKKIMKAEAEDAFAMQNVAIVVVAVAVAGTALAAGYSALWLFRQCQRAAWLS